MTGNLIAAVIATGIGYLVQSLLDFTPDALSVLYGIFVMGIYIIIRDIIAAY